MTDEQPVLLIVQEDLAFATAFAHIATQCGYEPHIIQSSREFSRAYRKFQPTAICMELFMPDFDGMEMVNWLIGQKSRSRVIVTAKNSPELAEPAILFTVTILARPASDEQIRAALQ